MSFKKHKFWDSQPVPTPLDIHLKEGNSEVEILDPKFEMDLTKDVKLPDGLCWKTMNVKDKNELAIIYQLLKGHYVEDIDSMFRLIYSPDFLQWALCPPNFEPEWNVGIVEQSSNDLVGFVSGIPQCILLKKKKKRLAPILIEELTRRAKTTRKCRFGFYTSGTLLPTPFSIPTYYIRKINIRKLLDSGFGVLSKHSRGKENPIEEDEKYFALSNCTKNEYRLMKNGDVQPVYELIKKTMDDYELCPIFESEEEVAHYFLPRKDVIYTYVHETMDFEKKKPIITDIISFIIVPDAVLNNPKCDMLKIAFGYYQISTVIPRIQLIEDLCILVKQNGCDSLQLLNTQKISETIIEDLRFVRSSGELKFYLFGLLTSSIPPANIGIGIF